MNETNEAVDFTDEITEQTGMKMSALHIGFLYVGSLMGAGFASGKESWQFFGVFGLQGLLGILLSTLIFMTFGFMTITIAGKLKTSDMSKLIFPTDSKASEFLVGIVMQVFLFMAYFSMLAAGGALFEEQFGVSHSIASLVLMVFVVFTTIRGFEKVSSRLQRVTPVLVGGALLLGMLVVARSGFQVDFHPEAEASPLASNWFLASISLVSYNLTAGIPILGKCAIHAKKLRSAQIGGLIGGFLLGMCSLILFFATLTDTQLAVNSALPMLNLCESISPWIKKIYALVLLIAVFGTATSTFYGVTTKLPNTKHRIKLLYVLALLGFIMSLVGFSNLVAFMYPIGGYCGLIFLIFLVINFVRVVTGKRVLQDEHKNS